MAKRYGRTLISPRAARAYRYDQYLRGSDHADKAGNCQRPVMVSLTGLQDGRLHHVKAVSAALKVEPPWVDYHPDLGFHYQGSSKVVDEPKVALTLPNIPVHVDIAVRCRKCETCLAARAASWRIRASAECRIAPRTWFGTLTLNAQAQFINLSTARLRLAGQGVDFDTLPVAEQFSELARTVGPEITKWLKRVRKSVGPFRYILVVEAHKSGLPHFHCLIHEVANPVLHRVLSSTWRLGFTNFKLIDDDRHAGYVCKYLSKSSLARVRASKDYGRSPHDPSSALVQAEGDGGNPYGFPEQKKGMKIFEKN